MAPKVVFSSAIFSKTASDIFLTLGLSIRPSHFFKVFLAIQTYEGVASLNSAYDIILIYASVASSLGSSRFKFSPQEYII